MKGLTVPADTIVRCRDQPAVLAHALGEMVCGPWQHVVRRFEPGHMPRAVAIFQRAEAQEGMQMVRLAANRLDSGMQLAAIDIAPILALASPCLTRQSTRYSRLQRCSVRKRAAISNSSRSCRGTRMRGPSVAAGAGIGSSNKPTSPPLAQFTSCGAICACSSTRAASRQPWKLPSKRTVHITRAPSALASRRAGAAATPPIPARRGWGGSHG